MTLTPNRAIPHTLGSIHRTVTRRDHTPIGWQVSQTRFSLAGFNPTQKRDLDDQRTAQHEQAGALVAALQELRHHLLVAQPHYVFTDTYVFGGGTTTQNAAWAFTNPFQSPAQYRIVQMTFTGAGTALITAQRGFVAPAATTVYDPSTQLSGQVFAAPGALTVCGSDGWTDIPGAAQVFLAVAATSAAAYATIQFRRRISPAGVFSEGHS